MSNGATTDHVRCIALIGPQSSGKTSLLESLLNVSGTSQETGHRKGTIKAGSTLGDMAQEARAQGLSTELNLARLGYLGDRFAVLDCPGSIELGQVWRDAVMVADLVVVVVEPSQAHARMIEPMLRRLDELAIPHLLFINKVEAAAAPLPDVIEALQTASGRPLAVREMPLTDGEKITGYVDLVHERAWAYEPGKPSRLIRMPGEAGDEEQLHRDSLLETLADFDDGLMEQLLEDAVPPPQEIFEQIHKDLAEDLVVPVLFGSAERDHGITRLLKLLRHDTPAVSVTANRLAVLEGEPAAQCFATQYQPHVGKLSLVRVWRGALSDNATLGGDRLGGIQIAHGEAMSRVDRAGAGDVVALGRLEGLKTGQLILGDTVTDNPLWPEPLAPVFALAVAVENRADEVKLSQALARALEEDPSLAFRHDTAMGEMVLSGQGDLHLRLTLARVKRKSGVAATGHTPTTAYKETIRKPTEHHARHKKQSGGHGQFADIKVKIAPRARGAGFQFVDRIVGGAVPRQFIPSVETGCLDALKRGPLGFEVVDVEVTLFDGQFHSVDSSDQAFQTAARQAMREALPACDPVLLEPIMAVTIETPTDALSGAQRVLTGRRGQILGFGPVEGREGWDALEAHVPQAELQDMIVELRSVSGGLASFSASFDHLQELSGRDAETVVKRRREMLESV